MRDPATRQIVLINAAHFFTHYCLLILATAVLGMVAGVPALGLGTGAPGAFGGDYGAILALGTGMFVLYGLGALPMGWLAERIGRRTLITIFFFGTGGAMIAAGFAPTPVTLGIALAVMGAFAAIYHPIGTAMLVETAGNRVGRAVGVNGVFGNLGVAAAPVVTAFVAAGAGWGWAFILPGVLCLAVGVVWAREPEFDPSRAPGAAGPFPTIPPAIVRRAIVVLLVIAAVSGLVFNAFTLLLPKLMQERLTTSAELLPLVGLMAFGATLCGGLTQFTVGRLLDRHPLRTVFLPLALVLAPVLALLAVADGWVTLALAALAAAAIFGQVTVNETMTARYVAPALRVKLYSIRFTVGFMGAAAASPMIAVLHGWTGSLAAALLVLAGCAAVTLACAFAFPHRPEELRPELWAAAPAE